MEDDIAELASRLLVAMVGSRDEFTDQASARILSEYAFAIAEIFHEIGEQRKKPSHKIRRA
jgi:hypothetical protein